MSADQRLKDALRLILEDPDKESGEVSERWYGTTAVHPYDWETVGRADYFYRRDTILVRTEDVDLVVSALREDPPLVDQRAAEEPVPEGPIIPENVAIDRLPVIDGVTGLVWRYGRTNAAVKAGRPGMYGGKEFGGRPDGQYDDSDALSTPSVLARLDQVVGVGKATPDHALALCGNGHPCPAAEPSEVPSSSMSPVPPVSDGICCGQPGWDGRGVLVGVVDSGLVEATTHQWPWMQGVYGDPDPAAPPTGVIGPYACHGTFVAGCVRCTAPKAEVCVKRAREIDFRLHAGMAYEHEIIRRMSDLLDLGADVIVCEFDGATRLHLPMHTFNAFHDRRLRHVNVVVVAPAGNDDTHLPTFPAAYSWVIGVGALSADGNRRAHFSNYGHWVDVYAPGEDLVNAFGTGDYTCVDAPYGQRHFDGLANWSGTSFSTPLVAGMIAARMSGTGENAPLAADAVLRFARSQAAPGIGPVLFPHQICGSGPSPYSND
ncbi:S8/S53 family peptidase [Kribbella sp. CA-253562]|uniref:S8/S53 family peptidase n=1 Tax=Kribbella sp. CA-253562 TaxID=3239942 RepID=UPI003D913D5A